jgi:two-component sensor histidine kinase/CheY-like chemotaxis protein
MTEAEYKNDPARQELLIAELNHRVRNIFGLIQGIINQSRDGSLSVDAFVEVVGGRVQSLARAHDLITADNWNPASIQGLIAAEAEAYLGGNANRVRLSGPDVLLEPPAFTTMALIVHELVTNSVKYGALSDQNGMIDIGINLDSEGRLNILWQERDGPEVKPPTRRGFGSIVIERSIQFDLNGEARVVYARDGLCASFIVPSNFVVEAPEKSDVRTPPIEVKIGTGALYEDVLLVEDNMIIALDVEETLRGFGIKEVRTAATVAQALAEIEVKRPDFGLLDINLGAEKSFEIASRLSNESIPFAFTSGYGEHAALPEKHEAARIVSKPYTRENLLSLLRKPA